MPDDLNVLAAFVAVAEERSFTRAARRLAVSPSALSHAIRGLEERLGVRLLARTTRSVAPTEAGDQLLGRLQPALGAFARAHPDVTLDISTVPDRVDLVAGLFDAGIQLGEFVERDMIAVRVSPDQRAAIVGSPRYFEEHPPPESPRDLTRHRAINFRRGESGVYRWEFGKDGHDLSVAVEGPVIVDNLDLLIRAALDGVGIAFTFEQHVAPLVESGALMRVLEDWCAPFPGYFLYYASRRQQPRALTALIDTLRM